MTRRALLITAALLALMPATALGVTIQTSDTSYPWQQWANIAQVPTWTGTLPLTTSSSGYFDCGNWGDAAGCTALNPTVDQANGQIIPNHYDSISTEIALGDSADYEQGYFLHELGQVFWSVYMTPADEDRFMSIVGLSGGSARWSYEHTTVVNGVTIHFPPFEWFAEGYRLCALFGVNQPASANTFSDFGYPGLHASFAARQRQVCQLIDRVGADNGISTPAQSPAMTIAHHERRVHISWGRRRVW